MTFAEILGKIDTFRNMSSDELVEAFYELSDIIMSTGLTFKQAAQIVQRLNDVCPYGTEAWRIRKMIKDHKYYAILFWGSQRDTERVIKELSGMGKGCE